MKIEVSKEQMQLLNAIYICISPEDLEAAVNGSYCSKLYSDENNPSEKALADFSSLLEALEVADQREKLEAYMNA